MTSPPDHSHGLVVRPMAWGVEDLGFDLMLFIPTTYKNLHFNCYPTRYLAVWVSAGTGWAGVRIL